MVKLEILPSKQATRWLTDNEELVEDFIRRSRDQNQIDTIKRAVKNLDAVFCKVVRENEDIGFVVLVEQLNAEGKTELYIWVAYSKVHLSMSELFYCLRFIEELAWQIGASTISFMTKRGYAWSRRLKGAGFVHEKVATFTKVLKEDEQRTQKTTSFTP